MTTVTPSQHRSRRGEVGMSKAGLGRRSGHEDVKTSWTIPSFCLKTIVLPENLSETFIHFY